MAANQSPWIMDSHVDGISVICFVVKTSHKGFQKVLQTVENTEKTGSLVVHFDGKFLHCHSILPTFSIGTLGGHYISYVCIYIYGANAYQHRGTCPVISRATEMLHVADAALRFREPLAPRLRGA